MDLRNLPDGLSAAERIVKRRSEIEKELDVDLNALAIAPENIGAADEKNCEQMFGAVPVPVGLAGPLAIHFSSGEKKGIYLPLATTEGALVASVNRGCKAITAAGGANVSSVYHGITRSIAFDASKNANAEKEIRKNEANWKNVAEATSGHLKILSYEIDSEEGICFLTIAADTDKAMGMNMVTIAAEAAGEWIAKTLHLPMITVAGNVDSDKKPSKRTHDRGRGFSVTASAEISAEILKNILKTDAEQLARVAHAKLHIGSRIAGALGANLHAANIIAALYLSLGQDAAHVVEGSLADTTVTKKRDAIQIVTKIPALLVGVRGGGTDLPAQQQCLGLLLKEKTSLHPSKQLAESIGAAVLAGELSLLAAQATHTLAKAHTKLGR